jgi:O-antigen/teichoic acid export membrane protein
MSAAARAGAIPAAGAGERRVAARGVVWGGVESAVSAAVGLVLTPLVVRATGLEGLGLWGASWSLAHTASLLDLGAGASYARFASRAIARDDADELNEGVAVGAGIHLTLTLFIAATAALVLPHILSRIAPAAGTHASMGPVVTLTLSTVLLRGGLSAFRGVVAGAQRTDLLGRIGAVASLAEGALGAAALAAGFGLVGMAAASLCSAAGSTIAEARAARRLCPRLRFRPFHAPRARYREIVGFGLRLQATRAFEVIGAHAPRLILAAGPGLAAAGVYDLGARLAGLTPIGAALPLRVILPLAGHLDARGDRERLEALARRATRYVALLALAPLSVVVLDAPALLTAWIGGPPAPGAAACARLLAAGLAMGLVASPLRLVIRACGHAGLEAAATAAGASVLVLGGAILARPWGAAGVAAAALGGASCAAVLLAARAAIGRVTAARPWRTLAAALPATASALTAVGAGGLAALVLTGPAPADRAAALAHLSCSLPFAVLAFAAVAAVTGAVRATDLALVREAAGRAPGEVRA